jgi:hypothetical protein
MAPHLTTQREEPRHMADATMGFAAAGKAAAAREAYLSDWALFAVWAALRGATALPAQRGGLFGGPECGSS